MSTLIEWSDESWNPIRARLRSDPTVIGWHCEHASPGCEHCYSETRNRSGRCNMGTKLLYKPGHRKDIEVFLDEAQLLKPLRWKKGRKVFVCSMTDLFADFVPAAMIDRIFAVMALCPQHTFQVLTKRADRMRVYMKTGRHVEIQFQTRSLGLTELKRSERMRSHVHRGALLPLPNVWLGVSVEDQQRADERIPDLLATPAAIRWISAEPLLGHISIFRGPWSGPDGPPRSRSDIIDWVVAGGESGPSARPMHPDWACFLRDQCAAADVPFFFKQWGEFLDFQHLGDRWNTMNERQRCNQQFVDGKAMFRVGKKRAGRLLDGVEHNGMPGPTNA